MPTTAAILTLNVPAITGLIAGVTVSTIVNQISTLGIAQGTSAVTCLTANSANWQNTYTTVAGNSGHWYDGINGINSFLLSTSGNWQNSYTTVNANSGNWQNAYTTLKATSSIYISLSSTVTNNLSTWNAGAASTNTVIANSGYWQTAYVTVSANQGAWGLNALSGRGPYSVIGTGTILPISGSPVVSLNTGSYNVITGGLSSTNSGNYNALVGGYRNYISGGNFNFIGTGAYNHIGGYSTTRVVSACVYDPTFGATPVLSGNGTCTKIFDTQGNNFSSTYSVGDVVGIAYTTNALTSLTANNTPFISGVVQAVTPTNNTNIFGSIVVQGINGAALDLRNATGLIMYDQSANCTSFGSKIGGGVFNTSSGIYSTVIGGGYNYALSGATVGGGSRNCATTNSFIGGGCGNWNNTPGSVIAAGSFNKTGGNAIQTTTGTLSTNGTCTVINLVNSSRASLFNLYDPVTVVSVGTNGLSAGTITTATVVGCNPSAPNIIVTGNYSAASYVATWDRSVNNSSTFNTIGGGVLNTATGGCSVVAGGTLNTAIGNSSVIAGGACNSASGIYSTIAGGTCIGANGAGAAIGGGCLNLITGNYGAIAGGTGNQVIGNCSAILGGCSNYTNYNNTFILGSNITALQPNTTYVNNLSVGGSVTAGVFTNTTVVGNISATGVITGSTLSATGNITTTGAISAAGNIIATGNVYGGTGITTIAGTTYTIQLSDSGGMIASTNNGAGLTATIVGSNYPVGFNVGFMQLNGSPTTGRVAVSGQNVTINQASGYFKTRTQYSTATLMYFGAPAGWVLFGDLAL